MSENKKIFVAWACEEPEDVEVTWFDTDGEAEAFVEGLIEGGNSYGAGNIYIRRSNDPEPISHLSDDQKKFESIAAALFKEEKQR
jgi:hypothetical protein